jgi:hypothetical protein
LPRACYYGIALRAATVCQHTVKIQGEKNPRQAVGMDFIGAKKPAFLGAG